MSPRPAPQRRRGAVIVESAFVLPVVFLLILALAVGGMGIFRYNEVANLARLTARYAAVHGGQYAQENAAAIKAGTLPTVDANYLTQNVADTNAMVLDTSKLNVSVTITTHGGMYSWDDTTDTNDRATYGSYKDANNNTVTVTNTVNVTVTYTWIPEMSLVGPITLTSTAVVPMSY
jgi:hypothetical protein